MLITRHVHLSDELIHDTTPPSVGEIRLWDDQCVGLLARIWPSGSCSFCVRYRSGTGTKLRTIGTSGKSWTTELARQKAFECLAHSPPSNGERSGVPSTSLSIGDLCDRYLRDGPIMKVAKRESSWKIDAMNLNRHVRPLLGHRIAADLRRADIAAFLRDVMDGKTAGTFKTGWRGLARVRGGRGSAERVLTTFRAMLNWAIVQDFLVQNPSKGLCVPKAPPKEIFLNEHDAHRLFVALTDGERGGVINPQHSALIRLLLLTGARKSELLALQWREVDLPRNRILLNPSRTKAGEHNGARRIPLNSAARAILEGLTSQESDFVFPSATDPQKHMTGIQKTWKRVCERAQLGSMRLHDLRHSFASFAIANGENIVVIAQALGHASARMTERYLHLRDEELMAFSERTGTRITRALHEAVPGP